MSIMEDKTILYSVRYPSAQEEGERIKVRGDRQAAEVKLTEFLRRMREERTYEPIPGREEKGRRFAALARELSQIYEVGLDILRTPDSIEAALHLYCSAYSRDMTRRLAELLGMCDVCAASRPRTEPSDLTLSLMLYTHRCYVSGRLISG